MEGWKWNELWKKGICNRKRFSCCLFGFSMFVWDWGVQMPWFYEMELNAREKLDYVWKAYTFRDTNAWTIQNRSFFLREFPTNTHTHTHQNIFKCVSLYLLLSIHKWLTHTHTSLIKIYTFLLLFGCRNTIHIASLLIISVPCFCDKVHYPGSCTLGFILCVACL